MIKSLYFMFFVFACLLGLMGCTSKAKDPFKNLTVDEFDRYNLNVMADSCAAEADELLDKERPVAVYCRSGKRSREAARILTKKGFKVVNLDKGFEHWKEFGKEVCY